MSYEYHKPESDQTEEDIISEKRILHDSNLLDDGAKVKDGRLEVTDYQRETAKREMDEVLKERQTIESFGGQEKYNEVVSRIKNIPESLAAMFDKLEDGRNKFDFILHDPEDAPQNDFLPMIDMSIWANLSSPVKGYEDTGHGGDEEFDIDSGIAARVQFGLQSNGKLSMKWGYVASKMQYIGGSLSNTDREKLLTIPEHIKSLLPDQDIEFIKTQKSR